MRKEIITANPRETFNIGEKLAVFLKGGETILLTGDLGAGKTTFAKGVSIGLGIDPSTPVVSPTFTLLNMYKARIDIVHADLYRLEPEGILDLGIEEYMDNSHVVMVEWADISEGYFKGNLLRVKIEYLNESRRKIILSGDIIKEENWR
jgi:tRNA threonylcarbamoyladenosine biosynthesis protein TsaE